MMQMEFDVKEYTQEEYEEDLRKLLDEKGLHDAVVVYADKIADEVRCDGYIKFSTITEWLCDILSLIDLEKEIRDEAENLQGI